MTTIIAPEQPVVHGPVVFLAGPTFGLKIWQDDAIALLGRLAPWLHVASPRRPLDTEREFTPPMYQEQVDWETRWLRRAGSHGVVMFWLAAETVHRCHRPHAQTTRFELGEWKEIHRRDGSPLVVGIEEGFTGGRYIRLRLAQECPRVLTPGTLEQTCAATVALAAELPRS